MRDLMLIDIAKMIWKKIWLVLGTIALCASIALVYCMFFATPVYSTKTSLVASSTDTVFNNNESITTGTVSVSMTLINTYVGALKSPQIYEMVLDETGLQYSRNQLMNMITVKNREGTLFIDISVVCTNSEHAKIIANKFAELAPQYLKSIIPKASAIVVESADSVSIISPRTNINVAVAGILGAAFIIILIIILEMLDQTIKGEEDFVQHYDVPVLGTVPDFENFKKAKGGRKNA
ncbi:MAG: Wzz/FepE/Etk N-terminal domain-containing protein [Oscillospiraceae bacterium]|nr:Wzz/FepE/Etk N-terminal domain-containing protein [Oscillospiraceae bacterium]